MALIDDLNRVFNIRGTNTGQAAPAQQPAPAGGSLGGPGVVPGFGQPQPQPLAPSALRIAPLQNLNPGQGGEVGGQGAAGLVGAPAETPSGVQGFRSAVGGPGVVPGALGVPAVADTPSARVNAPQTLPSGPESQTRRQAIGQKVDAILGKVGLTRDQAINAIKSVGQAVFMQNFPAFGALTLDAPFLIDAIREGREGGLRDISKELTESADARIDEARAFGEKAVLGVDEASELAVARDAQKPDLLADAAAQSDIDMTNELLARDASQTPSARAQTPSDRARPDLGGAVRGVDGGLTQSFTPEVSQRQRDFAERQREVNLPGGSTEARARRAREFDNRKAFTAQTAKVAEGDKARTARANDPQGGKIHATNADARRLDNRVIEQLPSGLEGFTSSERKQMAQEINSLRLKGDPAQREFVDMMMLQALDNPDSFIRMATDGFSPFRAVYDDLGVEAGDRNLGKIKSGVEAMVDGEPERASLFARVGAKLKAVF